MKNNQTFRRICIIVFWIALWQILAGVIHNKIIFAGPEDTFRALFTIITERSFSLTAMHSLCRIGAGFILGFTTGIVLAALSEALPLIGDVLDPLIRVLQAVPVASFVILALIWVGSSRLAIMISYLIVLPVIYRNVKTGISRTNTAMLEMSRVYGMPWTARIRYIYIPEIMPYLLAASRTGVGMAWKSGIAAEVIGVPASSLGEKLYMAKIYLATGELFAWTAVIILVSHLFEWIFLHLLKWIETALKSAPSRDKSFLSRQTGRHESADASQSAVPAAGSDLSIQHLSKQYGGKTLFRDLNLQLKAGGRYCLMGSSGCGKTTLIRIVMGLEQPDEGTVSYGERLSADHSFRHLFSRRRSHTHSFSAVFQEDRLFSYMTGPENMRVSSPRGLLWESEELMDALMMSDARQQCIDEMSGGMKRRIALARALAHPSGIVILDEPFNGLDEDSRHAAIRLIDSRLAGRMLVLITHQREDALQLGADILNWGEEV